MEIMHNISKEDVSKIAMLEQELFADGWSEHAIAETMKQENAKIIVAKDENVLGYAILYFVLDEAELVRIGVSKAAQRKGIGKALLEDIKIECKRRQAERLLLEVRESNVAARAFYKNAGFVEDGVRKNFYQFPTENAILMSLPI